MAPLIFIFVAFVVTVVIALLVVVWYFRITLGVQVEQAVPHPGHCTTCRYTLRGLAREGKCPECSTEFNLDAPIRTKLVWMTAPDAYRTLLRIPILLLCAVPLTMLQFPITYAHLRMADWSDDDALGISTIQSAEGSSAYIATWLLLLAAIAIPYLRYMSWKEFWATIVICACTPTLVVFLAGFHKSQWSQGMFAGFIHGTLTFPALLAGCITLALIIATIILLRIRSARETPGH